MALGLWESRIFGRGLWKQEGLHVFRLCLTKMELNIASHCPHRRPALEWTFSWHDLPLLRCCWPLGSFQKTRASNFKSSTLPLFSGVTSLPSKKCLKSLCMARLCNTGSCWLSGSGCEYPSHLAVRCALKIIQSHPKTSHPEHCTGVIRRCMWSLSSVSITSWAQSSHWNTQANLHQLT